MTHGPGCSAGACGSAARPGAVRDAVPVQVSARTGGSGGAACRYLRSRGWPVCVASGARAAAAEPVVGEDLLLLLRARPRRRPRRSGRPSRRPWSNGTRTSSPCSCACVIGTKVVLRAEQPGVDRGEDRSAAAVVVVEVGDLADLAAVGTEHGPALQIGRSSGRRDREPVPLGAVMRCLHWRALEVRGCVVPPTSGCPSAPSPMRAVTRRASPQKAYGVDRF